MTNELKENLAILSVLVIAIFAIFGLCFTIAGAHIWHEKQETANKINMHKNETANKINMHKAGIPVCIETECGCRE